MKNKFFNIVSSKLSDISFSVCQLVSNPNKYMIPHHLKSISDREKEIKHLCYEHEELVKSLSIKVFLLGATVGSIYGSLVVSLILGR